MGGGGCSEPMVVFLNVVRYALDQDKEERGDNRNNDEDRDQEPEPDASPIDLHA
jgi:hypothetical protein